MTAADTGPLKAFAPAKINLTLHVTGRRADGYHLLDSLVVFADVGDILWFEPHAAMSLAVTGPFAEGVPTDADNLVWRAALAAGQVGHIRLEKNLPHGAGIGSGSADAAAILRMFDTPTPAATLGADVPVCLSSLPQRMQGIGDQLAHCAGVPACHLVLVNPRVEVSTPQVFAALQTRENPGMGQLPGWSSQSDFLAWLAGQRNDLAPAAARIAPQITAVLNAMSDSTLARMSGSGATCFGIYPSRAKAKLAAERIASAHPDWWVVGADTICSEKIS